MSRSDFSITRASLHHVESWCRQPRNPKFRESSGVHTSPVHYVLNLLHAIPVLVSNMDGHEQSSYGFYSPDRFKTHADLRSTMLVALLKHHAIHQEKGFKLYISSYVHNYQGKIRTCSVLILLTLCVNHCSNSPNVIVNLSFNTRIRGKEKQLYFQYTVDSN